MDSYDPFIELHKDKPDFCNLIILDIKIPELDGFSLYRKMLLMPNIAALIPF